MAYTPHTWQTSEPITQEKMNNIEEGIQERALTSTLNSNVQSLQGSISDVQTIAQSAKTTAENASRDVAAAQQGSVQGQIAWSQVAPLTSYYTDANGNIAFNTNLKTRIENHEQATDTAINNINEKIGGSYTSSNTVYADINGVRSNLTIVQGIVNRAKGTYSDIQARLDANDATVETHAQAIEGINDKYTNAKGTYATIEARFKATEDEVKDARGTYADIDARLDADETDIGTNRSNIVTLNDTVVFKSNVIDDFTHTDTQKPLSANKGKELKETIGGTYSPTNTVAAGIVSAANTAENNAKAYADTNKVAKSNIYNDIDYVPAQGATDDKVLDARQGKVLSDLISNMGTAYQAADSALDIRLDVIEDELGNARINSGTLDDRFDAVELRATTLETQVTNIANELNMTNIAGQVQDTTSRIDTLESNVVAMANEIGMLQNGAAVQDMASAIAGDSTRIDTIEADLNTASTGIKARMSAAEAAISHTAEGNDPGGLSERMAAAESAISTKANASDVTSALSNKADTSYVNTQLAGKADTTDVSLTIVKAKNEVTYVDTEDGKVPSGTQNWTIVDRNDYLLQNPTDDKYYYWKHISNTWHLMGGAGGGTGSSSGEFVATLEEIDSPDLNVDYFVGNNEEGYFHYRFIENNNELQRVLIGVNPSQVKSYALSSSVADDKNYIDFYQFNYGVDSSELDQGTRIAHIELVGGGGGGTFNSKEISRISIRSTVQSLNSDDKVYLRFFYTSGEANESDNYTLTQENATMAATIIKSGTIDSGDPEDKAKVWPTKLVYEDGTDVDENNIDTATHGQIIEVPKKQSECPVGFYEFDITNACKTLGKQTFTLRITDIEDEAIYTQMKWEVTVINLIMRSDFSENVIVPVGTSIEFNYTPESGANVEKTAYFQIDDGAVVEVPLGTRTSEQTYIIPAQSIEGAHMLRARLGTPSGNQIIYSEYLYRDLIWRNTSSDSIILSSPYRNRTIDRQQYNIIEIPYTIAGNASSYTVQYYVDNMDTPYNEVVLTNKNTDKWTYRPYDTGTHILRIKVENTYIDITINVSANEVDIDPYSVGLILDFNPAGLSNNSESARNWNNGTYHLTTSDNFDWQNGGYGSDSSGEYFLIKSGTRAYFDYKMFTQDQESVTTQDNQTIYIPTSKVYQTGQEMKIIFKTSAVRNIKAVWFSNAGQYDAEETNPDKRVGIELSVHEGWLKTNSASNEAVGEGDEQVAATNTYLYFPYSEEDRIELDININKEDSAGGAVTMSYEDGVPSKAYAYTHNQILYQVDGQESIITIGSDDCDVYVYKFRIYNKELTPAQILRNFIADGKTVEESITRYQRNCIYYDAENDEYSPYEGNGFELNAEALAEKIPNVKVLMLDTPTFTLNKKSFIKGSSLRCIHALGGSRYASRGAADNWYFENGYHAGQGTTSDKYGDSGRNIDFLFNCDGTHQPSDKVKNPDPEYISQVTTGYGTPEATVSQVQDWMGPENEGKVSLTSTSIPNNFFNFKVNIASSENVNNALLQKRYTDFVKEVYQSPAYQRDHRIKNDMEFVPAVLFVRENSETLVDHSEFGDRNWHFYALGNLGDSKKTDYTRAYDPTDIYEFTIEISDNNTNNSQFQTGVYMVNGVPTLETFEAVQDIDDDGNLIEDSYTAQGRSGAISTTDYVYPLDTPELKAMWDATDPQTGEYLNKNHWSLVNEPYDGDHSFEMRYAYLGNYRDGKLVNGDKTESKAVLKRNSKVWQAFYSWVVTSSNEEFVRDLDQWCVRRAVEFWYAFTHYYTMMDSRAKNTFWHFAKTGQYRKITNPIKDMLHVYAEETYEGSGIFEPTADTDIVSGKEYWTEYAFDLWDYDNDTALGIDNNGELIFPYGKEDNDYKIAGNASSGYVFNGAGSVLWRRLRDLCSSEISTIFNTVNEQFFSAENLIQQFDEFQECYPEALWQVDIQRKYIRPFTGDKGKDLGNDNYEFKTRKNVRFLETMMQGRKKYQRRQWIKDQYYYFGSKYKLNNITEDFFLLDCYSGPDDALIADLKAQGRTEEAAQYVGSNWDITITPYQDMYINASFGETAKTPIRATAGEPIEMKCPFTDMNNTRIYIYGASRLSALAGKAIREDPNDPNSRIIGAEGLASLYMGNNQFMRTEKLQHLYIGTDKPTYRNANLNHLTLNEDSPILETLDIRNCGSIAGELKLGGCNNLRILQAEGTGISLVTLPASSQITILHLPSTVTSLSLTAAKKLNDFYIFNKSTGQIDYSNLRSILIDSSDKSNNINWLNIASTNLNNLNYLYLLNLETSSINDIEALAPFEKRKEELEANGNNTIELSGILNVTGEWSEIEKDRYETIWPELELSTLPNKEVTRYAITYKYNNYYDSNNNLVIGDEIMTLYIRSGTLIPDIADDGTLSTYPTRTSTVRYDYIFGQRDAGVYVTNSGWKNQGSSTPFTEMPLATRNMTIETYFTEVERKYQVRWFMKRNDNSTLVKMIPNTSLVSYGHGETLEAPTVAEIHAAGQDTAVINSLQNGIVNYSIFDGWEKLPIEINPTNINSNYYDIYAHWDTKEESLGDLFADTTNLTPEQLFVYAHMNSDDRNSYADENKIGEGQRITVNLGQDSLAWNETNQEWEETGTTIVGLDNILRFDIGTPTPRVIDITPHDDFTIMIEYSFNPVNPSRYNSKSAGILMSCYYQNSNDNIVSGFALYDNLNSNLGTTGPRIGYGDMFNNASYSISVSGKSTLHEVRNVLVLRHPKDEAKLYVYSGLNDNKINSEVTVTSLNWAISPSMAKINLGQLTDDTSNEYRNLKDIMAPAHGTIYQMKYWNKDLGIGECKRLAAWPHETITFGLANITNGSTSGSPGHENSYPSLLLNTLSSSNYGHLIKHNSTGWGSSPHRAIANNHIMLGLPTKLQSVLGKPAVKYQPVMSQTDSQGGITYYLSNSALSSYDYIFFPTVSNLTSGSSSHSWEVSGNDIEATPFPWINTGGMTVYDYNGTNWTVVSGDSRYKNLRFPIKPLKQNVRIFRETSNSFSNTNTTIEAQIGALELGDIFIDITGNAYMYISNDDINKLGLQREPSSGIFVCTNGGWMKSCGFWARSMMIPDSGGWSSNQYYPIYSNKSATLVTAYSTNNAVSDSEGLGLNYSITI